MCRCVWKTERFPPRSPLFFLGKKVLTRRSEHRLNSHAVTKVFTSPQARTETASWCVFEQALLRFVCVTVPAIFHDKRKHRAWSVGSRSVGVDPTQRPNGPSLFLLVRNRDPTGLTFAIQTMLCHRASTMASGWVQRPEFGSVCRRLSD